MSWLSDRLREAQAQINPWDKGKTAATVRRNRAPAPPAQTVRRTPQPGQGRGFGVVNPNYRPPTRNPRPGQGAGYGVVNPNRFANQEAVDRLRNESGVKKFIKAGAMGIARSATGVAQGASGLYDLATPGTGTNRVSKKLDKYAKQQDEVVKQVGYNKAVYKGGQLAGEVAGFKGAASLANQAVKRAPQFVRTADNAVNRVATRATANLARKGALGKATATGIRESVRLPNQIAEQAVTAKYIGEDASKGKDITPLRVATDVGAGAALNVGIPMASSLVKSGVTKSAPVVKKGAQKTAEVSRQVASGENPTTLALLDTQKRLQQQFDKTADPRQRRVINQQIADVSAQRRAVLEGGYIGTPGKKPLAQPAKTAPAPKLQVAQQEALQLPGVTSEKLDLYRGTNDVNSRQASSDRPVYYADTAEYAGTYGDVSSKQVEGRVLTADNIHSYDRINNALRKAIAKYLPAEEWKKLTGNEQRNIENWTNHTLEGERLSRQFNQPMPKVVKQAFADLGVDYIRIPGGQFPGTVGKVGHQTEIIEIPKPTKELLVVPNPRMNAPQLPIVAPKAQLATLPGATRELPATPSPRMNTSERDSLYASAPDGTPRKIKVAQGNTQNNIPVMQMEQNGQRVTATNVNPNIQKGEKRYIVDDQGELIPDSNGAYKVFTADDGSLKEIRIGDEVYSAKDVGDLTNIRNYGSTAATQRRNIERAFKDNPETGANVTKLVVDFQQEQATKMIARHAQLKTGMQEIAKDLGVSFGVGRHNAKKVSAAIQDFGEKKRDIQSLVAEFGVEKTRKIIAADKWFRNQYDSLLDEMNTTLERYGYDPVPKRDNYYTHFQEPTLWQKFGLKMQEINDAIGTPSQEVNPTGVRGGIPNTLAGQSEQLLPNRKFNQFTLRRKGDERTADAFQAFEKYIQPTLNNIYMTPAITRARVISKAIAMENDRIGGDANQVIVQMREWANHLAGKSNRLGDRQAADTTGFRQALQASNWVQRKVGGNSIVGNFATAILQPIVAAQTAGKAGYKNTLLALMQEASTSHGANAAIRQSKFLNRRYTDLSPITKNKVDRASDVAGLPLKVIEQTIARTSWQAFYNQGRSKGLRGEQLIKFADTEAEKTLAGRAIGEKPELYRSKSLGFATQFQLEVNNYIQQVAKEMTPAQATKTFIAAFGINLLLQEAIGRSVGFNPLDAAWDSLQTLAADDKSGGEKAKQIAQRWGGEVVGNAPIVSSALDIAVDDKGASELFGNETPVGRFGVGSSYSSLYDNTVGKVIDGKPLEAAGYAVAPFGYVQAQKTIKGTNAVNNGGLTDKDGNTTVEIPKTPGNYIRGALFGPSAIKEVNQYYNNIGKKEVDQKPVQNQTNSKAASQGDTTPDDKTLAGAIKKAELAKEERAAKLKGSFSKDDYAITQLSKDEQKKLVKDGFITQKKLDGLLNYETNKRKELGYDVSDGNLPKNYDKLDPQVQKFYVDKDANDDDWLDKEVDENGADLIRRANQIRPEGLPELANNNKVAKLYADFKQKQNEAGWGETRTNLEKRNFLKAAYRASLSKDDSFWLDANDSDFADAVDSGDISQEKLAYLVEHDNLLARIGGTAKIGNKVRRAYGLGDIPSKLGSSGGGSGSRSGRKKLASFDAFGLDTQVSGNKSLRQLLKKATMS